MSVIGYPESMKNNDKSDLRIWNNAAFDNGDSEDTNLLTKPSWSPQFNPSESMDSFSSKENQSPVFVKSPVRAKSSALPLQPVHPNRAKSVPERSVTKMVIPEKVPRDKIDEVIEEIESEIIRLKSRLELLKLEKNEQDSINQEKLPGKKVGGGLSSESSLGIGEDDSKNVGKLRGTVVRKNEEVLLSSSSSVRRNAQRRGFSMGPAEIMAGGRARQLGRQEAQVTPLTQQNRRKSCFWKLQDIEEEEKVESRGSGRNLSLSPKPKRSVCKTLGSRQAVTTVGSKKGVKKEDGVLASIQPKKLFMKDGEKSVPAKKPLKPGRIIASRYNQSTASSAMRKRSLPEDDDKDESKRCEKKRVSLVGKSVGTEGRVKKRWEIPNEIVIAKKLVLEENSPPTVSAIHNVLPKIRAVRLVSETPRDSGPAKKVAELVGRKSFFSEDDEEFEPPVCQTLSFAEESEDEGNY